VMAIERDGSQLRQLTSWRGEDGWPAWSPDGKAIVFTSTHNAGGTGHTLYVMKADGSRKRRLVRGVSGEFPVWSPDGKLIMFSGDRPGAASDEGHLWVVRRDGTGLREFKLHGWLVDWIR
jgi:TolB protein